MWRRKGSIVSASLKTDAPSLELVAREERALLAEIDRTREEARRIADAARAQARIIIEENDAAIVREIEEAHRASKRESAEECSRIHDEAEARLHQAQMKAQACVQQVVDDVLLLVIPAAGKDTP